MKKRIVFPMIITLAGLVLASCGTPLASSATKEISSSQTPQSSTDTLSSTSTSENQNAPIYKGMSYQKAASSQTSSSLNVEATTDNDIYTGEDFIIQIHFDNPNSYEIQSFTINGSKYSSYMFEKGSTMTLLLLKTTAPTTYGNTDYTIDAIKYIDGTTIKDVKIQGNQILTVAIKAHTPTFTYLTYGEKDSITPMTESIKRDAEYSLQIRFNNPDSLAFSSITLDGQEIAKAAFSTASTNEVIVINFQAPSQGGVVKHSLTEAKYTLESDTKSVDLVKKSTTLSVPVEYDGTYLPLDDPESPVTVTMWGPFGSTFAQEIKDTATAFSSYYNGKYVIDYENEGGFSDIETKLKASTATGQVAPLVIGYPGNLASIIETAPKYFVNIDNYATSSSAMSESEWADYYPAALVGSYNTKLKGRYTLPYYGNVSMMMYNKEKLVANNLSAPTTMDELDSFVTKYKEANPTTQAIGFDEGAQLITSYLENSGHPIFKDDETTVTDPSSHLLFNNETTISYVDKVHALINNGSYYVKNVPETSINYTSTLFNAGKLPITFSTFAGLSYYLSENFTTEIARIPEAKTLYQPVSFAFGAQSDPYVQKGAWLFYKFLMGDYDSNKCSRDPIHYPAKRSQAALALKDFGDNPSEPLLVLEKQVYELLKDGPFYALPAFKGSGTAFSELGKTLTYAITDTATQAVQTAYTNALAAL
jgi:hypothetical protein